MRLAFPDARTNGFFRLGQQLTISSLGLGSYLGDLSDETDAGYYAAVLDAMAGGVNLLDTAINYRHQRSEQVMGSALRKAIGSGLVRREEVVVCTKAGYLTPNAVPMGMLREEDIVRNVHCLHPGFLKDQIERSRENLGLASIDVHYLHNPETQLGVRSDAEFLATIRAAFVQLEECCQQGLIQFYGTATWDGYRRRDDPGGGLQLAQLVALANEVAGDAHHFRFIQLPFSLAMTEAWTVANQTRNEVTVSTLAAAAELGVTVIGSASILQGRLAAGLPAQMQAAFPEAKTDAQRALQFARSAPGITASLVGMSRRSHVAENLALTSFPPMPGDLFERLFQA
jgi:aryl-alcohol dehydrogenase-like predicted oxidoreductase